MSISTSQLVRMTVAKSATNTSLRWVPFFLPTLALAFDSSTATLAGIVGFGEMAGLATLLIARKLTGRNARRVMAIALVLAASSSAIALQGSLAAFAISFIAVVVATAFVSVGGQTWISTRVPFERRGRYIGIFEMSWASALLIGAPIIALLIDRFGWRGPYVALIIFCVTLSLILFAMTDSEPINEPVAPQATAAPALTRNAWTTIAAAAAIALAGLTTIVVVGTWLDDKLDVSTGGVGLAAMAFGLAELAASTVSASLADRLGKRRTTQAALFVLIFGLAIIMVARSSLIAAVFGLLFMFLGFEYAIVTSFSLVSESMPEARGRALATGNALGTLARGVGAGSAGWLYSSVGIQGPALVSVAAAIVAITLLTQTTTA